MVRPDIVGVVSSFDETEIAFQIFGSSGPPIIFGNGIGVTSSSVLMQIEPLCRRFRVFCWDHRGFFGSSRPKSGDVSIEAQAKDCLALMDSQGIETAGYVGWSMGVQVGFELLKLAPKRFERVAFLGGVAGNIFRATIPLPGINFVLDRTLLLGAWAAPALAPINRYVLASEGFLSVARRVGFTRPHVDRTAFLEMTRGVASLDLRLYLRTLAALGRHDASQVVAETSVPILFVVGDRDLLTPRRALEALARRARDARVEVVTNASHFALIEAPFEVSAMLDRFFRET